MVNQPTARRLLEPILDEGIRHNYFVNGRLLTATDLLAEAEADRKRHGYLGQAGGAGVAYGFEIGLVEDGASGGPPVLSVSAGLAVNAAGQPLTLPVDIPRLALARTPGERARSSGLFIDCPRPGGTLPGATVPPGTGAYVLVLSPATGFREKVPVRGFGPTANVDGCGSRFLVEGIQFRLEALPLATLPGVSQGMRQALINLAGATDAAGLSRLRNLLAHACFGTDILARYSDDPFQLTVGHSAFSSYGVLDALPTLTDCDVPLALLWWTTGGVRFVDAWAVRRRLTRPPVAEPWPLHVGQRRMAEAEAIFLQFQDQLRSLLNEANPGTIRAKDRFRYLPGAGYLPLDTGEFVADTFFDDVQTAPAEIDGAFLRWYIEDGMLLDPIDLAEPPSLLLFTTGSNVSPAYLVFQRRHREQITVVDESPGTPTDTTGQKPGGINVDVGVKKSGGPPGSIRPDVVIEQKLITATTAGGASTGGASTGGTNFMATTVLAAPTSKGIIGPAESIVSARYLDLIDKVNLDVIDVEIDERHIKVTATDDLGREYPGVFVEPRRITGLLVAAGVTLRRGRARFAIKNLPPGNYTVTARLFGFKSASQRRAVLAGQTPLVTLDLVRTTKGLPEIPEKPKALGPGKWIGPGWYDKVGLLPEYVRWPWPEPELIPNFDPVVDPPPPEVAEWLQDWVGWLQTEYLEAPIDPGGIRIFVNRDHTPDTVPQDAYAYAVFGDGGAFMPITLTPTDRSFAIDVPVAKGELAGIDRDLAGALANAGLGNLDLLAASWSGLVADTLGIGTSAAIDVIGESRTKVDSLQGTLGMLTGVDEGLITALAESDLNITSLAMLANADRQELASQLAGAGVTQAFAARLIDEARRTVSAGDWSLGPGALGLAPSEVSGLEAIGITSQGSFKAAAAKSELKAEIAETLGVSEAAIDALADTITIKDSKAIVTEIQEAAPVSSATGVTGATAIKLANLNIKTLGDLRKADPNLVAGVFGGNIGMAETAIGSARFKIGGN